MVFQKDTSDTLPGPPPSRHPESVFLKPFAPWDWFEIDSFVKLFIFISKRQTSAEHLNFLWLTVAEIGQAKNQGLFQGCQKVYECRLWAKNRLHSPIWPFLFSLLRRFILRRIFSRPPQRRAVPPSPNSPVHGLINYIDNKAFLKHLSVPL